MIPPKDAITASVTTRLLDWYPDSHPGMRCLYWMWAGLHEVQNYGFRAQPVAGSASFLMAPNAPMPNATHLTYEWGGLPDAERRVADIYDAATAMPECHCWAWLPRTQQIIDFSVGELPVAAERLGLKWEAAKPPDYYWDHPQNLAPRAIYIPNRDATRYVMELLGS